MIKTVWNVGPGLVSISDAFSGEASLDKGKPQMCVGVDDQIL